MFRMSYQVGEVSPHQGGAPDPYDSPPPYSEQSVLYQPQTVPVERAYVVRNNEAERRAAGNRDIADTTADVCCFALCAVLCFCLFCDT